jgi:hypothetical protein
MLHGLANSFQPSGSSNVDASKGFRGGSFLAALEIYEKMVKSTEVETHSELCKSEPENR